MSLGIRTARDFEHGVTTLWLDGELTWISLPAVRSALAKSVAECPAGVIVELSGLDRARPSLLTVFATAARNAARDRGVVVLLCAANAQIAHGLAAFRIYVRVYRTHPEALAAVRTARPRWAHARLTGSPVAGALARNFVGEACLDWDLRDLLHPARLIVSELAANAIEHAGSDFDVTVGLGTAYLRIGVLDRSHVLPRLRAESVIDPAAPLADRGRGLRIVAATATHWGFVPLEAGKVVWAVLRVP